MIYDEADPAAIIATLEAALQETTRQCQYWKQLAQDRPDEPHNPEDELQKLLQAVESNGPTGPAWKMLKALVTEQLDRDEFQDCQVCNGTGSYMGSGEIHWGMHDACSACGGSGRIIVSHIKEDSSC